MDEAQWAKAMAGNHIALPSPLPGKFCELPRCFLKRTAISPLELSFLWMSEKEDSPQPCTQVGLLKNM